MFTPSLGTQIAANERYESVCENDEEYGLKYGQVGRPTFSAILIVAAIVILFLVIG